jgi:signal transduction histidine kinase
MLDNLLDLTKIESGNITMEYTHISIPSLVENILSLYTIPPQVHIKKTFSPDALSVRADKDKIQQIIMNIFNNALNYTQPAGYITISSKNIDTNIVISIENDGPGIPKEEQDKIFNKFFRDKSKKGSGLGLSIAKKLVDIHKGRIWVESNGVKGNIFSFSLPKQ